MPFVVDSIVNFLIGFKWVRIFFLKIKTMIFQNGRTKTDNATQSDNAVSFFKIKIDIFQQTNIIYRQCSCSVFTHQLRTVKQRNLIWHMCITASQFCQSVLILACVYFCHDIRENCFRPFLIVFHISHETVEFKSSHFDNSSGHLNWVISRNGRKQMLSCENIIHWPRDSICLQ